MNDIQSFIFDENVVRVAEINGSIWFVAIDVCRALGLKGDASQHLRDLEPEDRLTLNISQGQTALTLNASQGQSGRGGVRTVIGISEGAMYHLAGKSKKPEAKRFWRWVTHEVLPTIRRQGFYDLRRAPAPDLSAIETDMRMAPLAAKVGLLNLVERARGKQAAIAYMAHLGLPEVPPPAVDDAGEQALDMLLSSDLGPAEARVLIRAALDGDDAAARLLLAGGIRVEPGFFVVANTHPAILRIFRRSPFRPHYRFLRRVDGAEQAEPAKYGGHAVSRGVRLPAFYVDEDALH